MQPRPDIVLATGGEAERSRSGSAVQVEALFERFGIIPVQPDSP